MITFEVIAFECYFDPYKKTFLRSISMIPVKRIINKKKNLY